MNNLIEIKGVLTLKAWRKGDLIVNESDYNLITTSGTRGLHRYLSGDTFAQPRRLQLGSDDTAVDTSQSALVSPFGTINFKSREFQTGYARLKYEIDENTFNGQTIREYGMLTQDGQLIARKVATAIDKDSTVFIRGNWDLVLIPRES